MLSFFILSFSCSQDKNFNLNNATPEAVITSHNEGDQIYADQVITFRATVTDDNNTSDELEVQWFIEDRMICPFLTPDNNGQSSCTAAFEEGEERLIVEVRDPQNATGTNSITLDVQISSNPVVSILKPLANMTYYSDQIIEFQGQASDLEDLAQDLIITWSSNLDGDLSLNTEPDSDGRFTDFGFLNPGAHGITLHVEDSAGKTASESISITVNASNTAPSCEITSPQSGSSSSEGELIIFEAEVSDPDIEPYELTVEWSSDKDGPIGTSTPNSSGTASFPYDALSANTHVISVTVTDENDAQCVDDIIYTVGTPPQINLTSPLNGAAFNTYEPINFSAEISDAQDASTDISVEWISSLDGLFSTTSPNSNGIAQFSTDTLSAGAHTVTVKAIDTDGLFTDELINISINGTPSQPTVSISPSPATTNDNLVAAATGSIDPDGDPVVYSYEWLLNGNIVSTGQTLNSSLTVKGELWTARAIPSDGMTTGNSGSASIIISNTPPEIQILTLSPSHPSALDNIICSAVTFDADGDSVSINYTWTIDGNIQSATGSTLMGPFQVGETITCEATPDDGMDLGISVQDSVTISNGAPVLSQINLSPSTAGTEDIITASIVATDPEGDSLNYTWTWFVDDGSGFQSVQSTPSTDPFSELDGLYFFNRDDLVYVEVEVSDGFTSSLMTSGTLNIINTPPSIFNVVITPANPNAGEDLTCSGQTDDLDTDSVSIKYTWELNGQINNTTTDTVLGSNTSSGETWSCTVTPNDGQTDGPSQTVSVTIDSNSAAATGSDFCAAAGTTEDSDGYSAHSCLSAQGFGGEAQDSDGYIWLSGSHYTFSPE